ncbi:replication initiator protein [Capybara microvirus Cap1_SP_124]|nr:replication initiator protein [Capybara microvirus Cap1_SP_124]
MQEQNSMMLSVGTNKSSGRVPTFFVKESQEMVCLNPITAWKKKFITLGTNPQFYEYEKKIRFKNPNDENFEQIQIPCGKCLGCRLDHANAWATRIMLEAKNHEKNCFITLTYDPKNLPLAETGKMTLKKSDIQKFFKRLREKTKLKLSYFCCGEYGPRTFRPHYHAIIFGYEPSDLKLRAFSKTEQKMFESEQLSKTWGLGFITIEELNYKTACYTARYVQKKAGLKTNSRKYTGKTETKIKIDERTGDEYLSTINKLQTEKFDNYGREKEFIVMSKKPAIGLNYWLENKEKILRNKGILIKIDETVKLKPIPRYFEKIMERENKETLDRLKHEKKQNFIKNQELIIQKIKNNFKLCEELTNDDKTKIYNNYLNENLTNRAKYLKRGQI